MKLYVVVDSFLDRSQQAVQASHAVAAMFLEKPVLAALWGNSNIILKKAKNIEDWAEKADAVFREPYWDNRVTACASYREDGFAKELPFV